MAIVATALTAMYSARFFLGVVFPVQKRLRTVRLSEPIIMPMLNLSLGATIRGSVIRGVAGPFSFESFNPTVKFFLIFMVVVSPAIVLIFSHDLSVSKDPNKVLLFSARRGMLYLANISTQGVLGITGRVIQSISKVDQSWLEIGQVNNVRLKNSSLFPAMIRGSFFIILVVFIFITVFV